MYYLENDTPAMARTSNLNEELGQVRASWGTWERRREHGGRPLLQELQGNFARIIQWF